MVIGANDSTVAIETASLLKANPNAQSNWKTDGKERQDALMDGSITETRCSRKGGVPSVSCGVVGLGSFSREFKVCTDGNTLELKETGMANGRTAEYKLSFTH